MAEVMRPLSQEQQFLPDGMDREMIEMSNQLVMATTTNLGSIQEEFEKRPMAMDEENAEKKKTAGQLHVPPRRAFTASDYILPTAPVSRVGTPSTSPRPLHAASPAPQHLTTPLPSSPAIGLGLTLPMQITTTTTKTATRSYSVMDYEPVPFTHQPGTTLQLAHLPAELHYALFDFLDPIDSVCLALTSRHFYAVHWAMHGKVSLASRREGPNDMEWVWRHAGPFLFGNKASSNAKQNSLAMLSPRGQVYCRKCRTARCELHKHIREWMGADRDGRALEYCVVTERFGCAAPEGAKGFCYRSSPRHPNRCGRHTRNQRAVRLT